MSGAAVDIGAGDGGVGARGCFEETERGAHRPVCLRGRAAGREGVGWRGHA